MLSLKISDKNVDLPDDFSFTMNLKSPIFGNIGSYSYPFKLPNTPRNASILEFRHRIEGTGDVYRTDDGAFLWNGISLFRGSAKLKTLNSKLYEGSMFEGEGDFFYKIKNLSLQQVDFGMMTFTNVSDKIAYINACKNIRYPNRIVAFPQVMNKSYFEELPDEVALQYFNYYKYGIIYEAVTPSNTRSVIVPMLYLRYVLKKIFERLGFGFDDSFFATDNEYNSLVIYNSVDCNSDTTGFFKYEKESLLFNYHLPQMNLGDFFAGLETFFNIRFYVNNTTSTVRLISIAETVNSTDYVEFSKDLISISTDIEEKITGFELKMEIDTDDEYSATADVTEKNALEHLKASVQSVSDLPPWPASDIMDMRFVYDENLYYRFGTSRVWAATPSSIGLLNLYSEVIYRNKDQTINTKFSTLFMNGDQGVIGNTMANWRDVTPKLLFVNYIDSGSGWTKDMGQSVTATKNLFFGGSNGLFIQHYKDFFDFRMSTKLVKAVKLMTFMELKEFDFSKKYMIRGIKYLVKTIQVPLKKDRIMPALLELYPCN